MLKTCVSHLFGFYFSPQSKKRRENMRKKNKRNNCCLLFALISNVKFLCPAVDDWNLTIEIAGSTKPHFPPMDSHRWLGRGWVHQKCSVSPNLDCLLLISEIMDFLVMNFRFFPKEISTSRISYDFIIFF